MKQVLLFFLALLLTEFTECAVLAFRFRRDRPYFLAVVLVNAITNIALNLLMTLFTLIVVSRAWIAAFAVFLEILVVLTEYVVLKNFDRRPRLFYWILGANVLSASAGSVILYLISKIV